MCNTGYIIAVLVINKMAALFLPLFVMALQIPDINLVHCILMVEEVLAILKRKRDIAEAKFHSIYTGLVLTTVNQLDIDVKLLRHTGHQIYQKIYESFIPSTDGLLQKNHLHSTFEDYDSTDGGAVLFYGMTMFEVTVFISCFSYTE